jgi:protein-disulfide isomerase
MKKLLVVASFAAFAAGPAAACDWNREASAQDPVVATTAMPTEQTAQATPVAPATTKVAADESARKPIEPVLVVLVTDRH